MNLEITLDDAAIRAAIGRYGGSAVAQIIRPSLERRANDARREAVRAFVSRGIGRGIFGRNDSGAWKLITLSPTQMSNDGLSLTLKAGGLAGMQETGGRTRPHIIKPKRAKVLAFAVAGEMAFAKIVNHPGGTVKQYPALRPAAEKIVAQVLADVAPALLALWEGRAA